MCNGKTEQLAASQAEVERLTKIIGTLDEQRLASDRELVRLREEVARLSRPVKRSDWCLLACRLEKIALISSRTAQVELAKEIIEPLLQSERNARESAEAERDELREACNKYVAISNTSDENKKYTMYAASERHGVWGNRCVDYAYDTPADAVLAAYRAERAVKHGDS